MKCRNRFAKKNLLGVLGVVGAGDAEQKGERQTDRDKIQKHQGIRKRDADDTATVGKTSVANSPQSAMYSMSREVHLKAVVNSSQKTQFARNVQECIYIYINLSLSLSIFYFRQHKTTCNTKQLHLFMQDDCPHSHTHHWPCNGWHLPPLCLSASLHFCLTFSDLCGHKMMDPYSLPFKKPIRWQ